MYCAIIFSGANLCAARKLFSLQAARSAGFVRRKNVARETFFILDRVHQADVTGRLRHGRMIAANHRTCASLGLGDRPAETFVARRKDERSGEIVERFEQITVGENNFYDAIGDAKLMPNECISGVSGSPAKTNCPSHCFFVRAKIRKTPSRFLRFKAEPT